MNQWIDTRYSSDRGLRLGINIVVYALTQEGPLAPCRSGSELHQSRQHPDHRYHHAHS
jgi:hypothetical protein